MSIVERVKNICLKPDAEWTVIAGETTSTADLFKGYIAPLAIITLPRADGLGPGLGGVRVRQAMDESSKKMEAARKSGDPNAQAAAAMEGLGSLLGGGKHIDPIGIDQLKPFVPDSFAGLPKLSSNAEKSGFAALMVSKAAATYGDHAQKNVSLEVSDTGGASGLLGLAAWANVQGEKEDDNGFERTERVNGRLVHEQGSKHGGSNEFSIVLGNRFVVSARGRGVDLAALKTAVSSLDLAKLEAMKDVGVQK